jgi:sensor histidine kinase YesM
MKQALIPTYKDLLLFIELWLLAIVICFGYFSFIEQAPLSDYEYSWGEFLFDSSTMLVFIALSLTFNRLFIHLFKPLQHYLGKILLYSIMLLLVNTLIATLYTTLGDIPRQEYAINIYVFSLIATFISGIHANVLFQKAYRKQTEQSHQLQMENAHQKEVNLQTSLMALKSQVDPHFLFNNFSILSDLIEENPKDAHIFLDNLSRVYRYKLVNMTTDLVTLNDEMKMLRSYISLINSRFGDAIKVNMPDDIPSKKLPPLALQLLVENAIKHNAHSRQNPLIINITISNDAISVSNAIMPLSSTESSTGLGLKNLQARYELLAGKKIEIYNNGQEFKTTIPLM